MLSSNLHFLAKATYQSVHYTKYILTENVKVQFPSVFFKLEMEETNHLFILFHLQGENFSQLTAPSLRSSNLKKCPISLYSSAKSLCDPSCSLGSISPWPFQILLIRLIANAYNLPRCRRFLCVRRVQRFT